MSQTLRTDAQGNVRVKIHMNHSVIYRMGSIFCFFYKNKTFVLIDIFFKSWHKYKQNIYCKQRTDINLISERHKVYKKNDSIRSLSLQHTKCLYVAGETFFNSPNSTSPSVCTASYNINNLYP